MGPRPLLFLFLAVVSSFQLVRRDTPTSRYASLWKKNLDDLLSKNISRSTSDRRGNSSSSLYAPPESSSEDAAIASEIAWERKVQRESQLEGNKIAQQDILRKELGKG